MLMNKASVMLFMKGNLQEAKYGLRRPILTKSTGVDGDIFVLGNEKFAKNQELYIPSCMCKWTSELVEGLDVLKKDKESGELLPIL